MLWHVDFIRTKVVFCFILSWQGKCFWYSLWAKCNGFIRTLNPPKNIPRFSLEFSTKCLKKNDSAGGEREVPVALSCSSGEDFFYTFLKATELSLLSHASIWLAHLVLISANRRLGALYMICLILQWQRETVSYVSNTHEPQNYTSLLLSELRKLGFWLRT